MAQTGIVVAMRRLMMVLAVVSLLMSAGIAVVWVRSYWRGEVFMWYSWDGQVYRCTRLITASGGVGFGGWSLPGAHGEATGYRHYQTEAVPHYPYAFYAPIVAISQTHWRLVGFQISVADYGAGPCRFWVVPCWFLVLLTLILPSVVMVRRWRRGRARAGFEVLPVGKAARGATDPTCGSTPGCTP